MRQDKILGISAFAILLLALTVRYGVHPLAVAKPRLLPVATMPRQIGIWKAGPDLPIPPVVQQKLPTAQILDRNYIDPAGRSVELLLLTATRREDMHDPSQCLPSQGWVISNKHTMQIDGQKATAMNIDLNGADAKCYYWYTGYYAPPRPANPIMARLGRARSRLLGKQDGMSLFVRLMAADNTENTGALDAFAQDIGPQIDALVATDSPAKSVAGKPGAVVVPKA